MLAVRELTKLLSIHLGVDVVPHLARSIAWSPRGRRRASALEGRRFRERQRRGVACVARVPVHTAGIERLVQAGRLQAGETTDRQSIATAIELLVDDFAKGWLIGTARPPKHVTA